MPPQPRMTQLHKKTWIQQPITKFLTKRLQNKCYGEALVQPACTPTLHRTKNKFCKENTSPNDGTTKELVCNLPKVDTKKVDKNNLITEFKADKKNLATVNKCIENNSSTKSIAVCDNFASSGMTKSNESKSENFISSHLGCTKEDEILVGCSLASVNSSTAELTQNSSSNINKTKKKVRSKLINPIDSTVHQSNATTRKRIPNEIKVASLVFPVLITEPAPKNLRHELNSLGIFEPFSCKGNGFQERLEDVGLEEIRLFIQKSEVDEKSVNMKICFYCGFKTESSLVLGRHLDTTHKGKFKRWPFTSTMDL